MLVGASDKELGDLCLQRDFSKYNHLSMSKCYSVKAINDLADWKAVRVCASDSFRLFLGLLPFISRYLFPFRTNLAREQ